MKKEHFPHICILTAFLVNMACPLLPAQTVELVLPKPGVIVHLSPPFNPPMLKGIKVYPENPFKFEFIVDKGDGDVSQAQLEEESMKIVKYFLASLTTPKKDLWVNLSPYEKDRIIPEQFGRTEMGRDLLAEDYMLKQITASLIYPEDALGKKFWNKIYQESIKKFHTTDLPINTFNKVWIVPEKAVVYENFKTATAYVLESKLKVMLESDYLSAMKNHSYAGEDNNVNKQVLRELIIPELNEEVNTGKNFAQLRQVYQSLILATWYKNRIKDSLLTMVYANKNKTKGVNIDNPNEKQLIYNRYLAAFKKGAYNYIKEEQDPLTQQIIPRKYFSGGVMLQATKDPDYVHDDAQIPDVSDAELLNIDLAQIGNTDRVIKRPDQAMVNTVLAGTVQREFGGMLRSILQDVTGEDEPIIQDLTDEQWTRVRNEFMLAIKSRSPDMVTDNVEAIFKNYFNVHQMNLYHFAFEHLNFNDLVLIAQSLHTVALSYEYFQIRSDVMIAEVNLDELHNRINLFSYAFFLDVAERLRLYGAHQDPRLITLFDKYKADPLQIYLKFARNIPKLEMAKSKTASRIFKSDGIDMEFLKRLVVQRMRAVMNEDFRMLSVVTQYYDTRRDATRGLRIDRILGRGSRGIAVLAHDVDRHQLVVTITEYRNDKQNAEWYAEHIRQFTHALSSGISWLKNYCVGALRVDVYDEISKKGEEFTYVMEVDEYVPGTNLQDHLNDLPPGNFQGRIKLVHDFIQLNNQLRRIDYFDHDVGEFSNIIIDQSNEMKLIDLDKIILYSSRDNVFYKELLIKAITHLLLGHFFDFTNPNDWQTVNDLTETDFRGDAFAGNIITYLEESYHDTKLGVDGFIAHFPASSDFAMNSNFEKGGIDLSTDKMLSVQNDGQAIEFHLDPAMLNRLRNTLGFKPIIVGIRPLSSIRNFLTE